MSLKGCKNKSSKGSGTDAEKFDGKGDKKGKKNNKSDASSIGEPPPKFVRWDIPYCYKFAKDGTCDKKD